MPGPRAATDEKKMVLLATIMENREILFGQLSSRLTAENKTQKWENIRAKAIELELCSEQRDYQFVRDKMYGVWKSRTLKKRDNARRTGTTGGVRAILTNLDNKILDIIGTEAPIIDGILVGETGRLNFQHEDVVQNPNPFAQENEQQENEDEAEPERRQRQRPGPKPRKEKRKTLAQLNYEKTEKQNKLMDLEIEQMQLQVAHKKYKISDIEKRYNLPQSEFTRDLINERPATPPPHQSPPPQSPGIIHTPLNSPGVNTPVISPVVIEPNRDRENLPQTPLIIPSPPSLVPPPVTRAPSRRIIPPVAQNQNRPSTSTSAGTDTQESPDVNLVARYRALVRTGNTGTRMVHTVRDILGLERDSPAHSPLARNNLSTINEEEIQNPSSSSSMQTANNNNNNMENPTAAELTRQLCDPLSSGNLLQRNVSSQFTFRLVTPSSPVENSVSQPVQNEVRRRSQRVKK